ncbi:MAG: hypothetical protein QM820_64950 [Minicystis sp.]
MKKMFGFLTAILMFAGACGGSESQGGDGGHGGSAATNQEVRGARYCEILMAYQEGMNVRIDVYNTFGLNDCPAEAWEAIDAAKIQAEHQAIRVILNGPRRWVIDRFENSSFLDPTTVVLGGIEMRKAGQIVLPIAEAASTSAPYTARSIERNTTYVFDAGKSVFELVDPMERVFVMQSFSMAQENLTEADLPALAARLTLPAGWTYRTRALPEALRVTAVNGVATVVQDELENTYQLSQP